MQNNGGTNDVFSYNGYRKKFKDLMQFPLNEQRTIFISEFLERPGVFSIAVGIPLPGTNRHHMLKSSMVTDLAGMQRFADNMYSVIDSYNAAEDQKLADWEADDNGFGVDPNSTTDFDD